MSVIAPPSSSRLHFDGTGYRLLGGEKPLAQIERPASDQPAELLIGPFGAPAASASLSNDLLLLLITQAAKALVTGGGWSPALAEKYARESLDFAFTVPLATLPAQGEA